MNSYSREKDFYNNLLRWGKDINSANKERVSKTLRMIPKDSNTVLEIGCGDGVISNNLLEVGFDVTGVDISKTALSHFQGKSVVATSDNLPFKNKSFDLVICAEVLEHLPISIYEKTLLEIDRIAKKYILVSTPNQEYLPSGFVKCDYCNCIYHMNMHVRFFDRQKHKTLFNSFKLVKTIDIGFWKQFPLKTTIEQKLLNIYGYKEGLICPCCGSSCVQKMQIGIIHKILLKLINKYIKINHSKSKARWIVSLYETT